jgi:hypothetical protein
MSNSIVSISKTAWQAIFIVLSISALPALFHLPLWVTIIASISVFWRIIKSRNKNVWVTKLVVPVFLLSGLLGIYLKFPSLFGGDAILSFFVIVVALKWSESETRRDGLLMIFAAVILSAIGGMYWYSLFSLLHMLLVAVLLLTALIAINDSQNLLSIRGLLSKVASLFLISLPLMVLFYVTLPRVSGPIWDIGIAFGMPVNLNLKRDQTGPIIGKSLNASKISQLSQSDDVVLVAEFANNYVPYKSRMYWRGPVYYDFNGINWQLDESLDSGKVLKSSGYKRKIDYDKIISQKSMPVSYSARVNANGNHWLYALDLPYGAFPETRITKNLQLTAVRAFEKGEFKYEMTGYLDYETNAPLSDKQRKRALAIPENSNPKLEKFSKELLHIKKNTQDIIQSVLEKFVVDNFTFNQSFTVGESYLNNASLDKFFFSSKHGNAMHFASSFAIIMRNAGIPARIVTGFRGGDLIALTDFVIVRKKHAHVWVEIRDDNRGWLRVEVKDIVMPPVSEQRNKQKNKTTNNSNQVKVENLSKKAVIQQKQKNKTAIKKNQDKTQKKGWLNWKEWAKSLDKWVLNYNPNRQIDLFSSSNKKKLDWSLLLIWTLVGVIIFIAFYTLLNWFNHRHKRDEISFQWQKFKNSLNKQGINTSGCECPSTLQAKIIQINPDLAQGTDPIIKLYLDIHYSDFRTTTNKAIKTNFKQLIKRFISMV